MSMVQLGTINDGSVPIVADIGGGLGEDVRIVLLVNYAPESPPGFPSRPSWTGAASHLPRQIEAGTEITVHAAEAKALMAAGAAQIDWSKAFFVASAPDGSRLSIPVSDVVAGIVEEIRAGRFDFLFTDIIAGESSQSQERSTK